VSAYRVCWLTAALSLGMVGLSAAIVLLKAALLILLPLFVAVGVLAAALIVSSSAEAAPWSRSRRVCRVALLWGAAGGAMAGFVALVGPLGLLVAVLLAATSPSSFRACRRGLGALRRPTAAQVDALARSLACMNPMYVPFELTFDLRLLTDRQLANAWRNSEAAVTSPSGPRAALRAVEERGRYLDEFERRQPSLLRAWLASDAGAPDGPLPFATASRPQSPTIDWDELIGGQATDR
jgi:hypothetical protein